MKPTLSMPLRQPEPSSPSDALCFTTDDSQPDGGPADRPAILFAAPMSLLDNTSGCALSMRTLLATLAARGWQAVALQAQVFDSRQAAEALAAQAPDAAQRQHAVLRATLQGVEHLVMRTRSHSRLDMTASEEHVFISRFRQELRMRRPGLVILWGSMLLEAAVMREARAHGVPVVFYLTSGDYTDKAAFRDVSLIVTDTVATAQLYFMRLGLHCVPLGKFIDPWLFKAARRVPEFITFINPSPEKGVNVFMPLARLAAREAPAIRFLVVQSRGRWATALRDLGYAADDFPNVRVVEAQPCMKGIYGATRALLMPSVWHESGGRVVVEALLNGIPVLTSRCGGPVELAGDAAIVFDLPDSVKRNRRTRAPDEVVRPWLREIGRLCSEPQYYGELVARVHAQAEVHDLQRNVDRFEAAVQPLLARGRLVSRSLQAYQTHQAAAFQERASA